MKLTFACILFASGTLALAADAGKATAGAMLKHWETSKALSLAVAEAMPADAYSFKATEAEMSFGEQINHIAMANGSYCSGALGEKSPIAKPDDNEKATAVKNVTAAYDYCISGLSKLSDADLMETVKRGENTVSKFELFLGGYVHAAHHRGQAEVYLRLKGVTPPAYKF